MSSAVLYTYPASFRSHKILIAAKFSGFDVKVADDFVFGETNKSPEFLEKFPVGKVPALETSDKKYIFESNAIAYYVGNEQLRGNNLIDRAQILQWISFADNEILSPACTWLFPCLGIMQYNKQTTERAKEDIKKALEILNHHLLTRTFLVGERITQADISLCCNLLGLYQNVLDPSFRKPYGNVNRWFITLINQPQFRSVLGEITLCEKMAQFDAKKFAELQQKSPREKSGKGKEKEEKQQKPKRRKRSPPKKQEEEEEEDPDETELIIASES
uniref:Elongation factor 1-gamma n=1 Tax=Plectreurys tristis TaxID=33319 RepID=A0A0B4VT61_PLETR|nr:elongation factor-1 gamma-like protein [Plectreurys tristis]